MNILLVTLDQFRADCLSCAGHPLVRTPHLDRLAREGVRFARHYSQAAPCGPGRASLYTGLYQMNHRVVGNGTPLDARFDNIALAARRAGYAPTLFGYTDQALDPRLADGPEDPRLATYEEVLPGFDLDTRLASASADDWTAWLAARGFDFAEPLAAYQTEPQRPEDLSCASFLTDRFIGWLARQDRPWFAHLSHLRPHPPYAAAGEYSRMYDPAHTGEAEPAWPDLHRLYARMRQSPHTAAPSDPRRLAEIRAQYLGMISEVDAQLGRLWDALQAAGQWDDTFILVTSDHGEQLGDHGLLGKGGFFEESYAVACIARDPRPGRARDAVVEDFTEAVDVFPTLCEAMGIEAPTQCEGLPLTPFLAGQTPPWWRDAAHWEFDWRTSFIARGPPEGPWDRRLDRQSLTVRRSEEAAYVQFADGSWLCFDLAADPTWRTLTRDPERVLSEAQAMLSWRARHAERTLTGTLIEGGAKGRLPPMPKTWGARHGP